MRKSYAQFIIEGINETPQGVPIFTDEITKLLVKEFNIDYNHAKKIVNTNLNCIKGTLILNFRKGIYYKPKTTVFGKTPLNPMHIVTKLYLKNDNEVFGYETSASLLQQIGFTTQI